MNRFRGIRFKGEFRSYQLRVLSNVEKNLADKKINIVAAPGSGKTVLGLELIRRLEEPCLILSPTTAIREQWGQRFKELFLEKEDRFEELFSTDLHKPKLLNSITYQALYMAMERISEKVDGETDCSDIDLLKTLRKAGIKTICLDEAHHLKKEWQKALEKFLKRLDGDIMRICLTATPPYDADPTEWTRYYNICGEIDEEIFVPELVAHGNLCPHQDYVYFNYPSPKEEKAFLEYKEQVQAVLEEVAGLACIRTVAELINRWDVNYHTKQNSITYPNELEAILVLLKYYGMLSDSKQIKKVLGRKSLPEPEEIYFEKALQFLLEQEKVFYIPTEQIEELIQVLRKHQVYQRKRVHLVLTEALRKMLISSVGKLKSIGDIATHEYRTLGKDLHMLILTDYNKGTQENIRKIGTSEPFHEISVVSMFETLRRLDETMKIGVLSGSLIFLPVDLVPRGTMVITEPLGDTGYVSVEMMGTNRDRIAMVGELFREGKLQILIGTKALLGEGWDEPCINSLILASFASTFVSTNQMRGRAIRSNPKDPHKTANIWHLVTLEPGEVVKETALERLAASTEEPRETLHGCDYEVVKGRFETFMAPHYETGEIQSGMDRLTLIHPPFDANGILRINREMLELSEDRAGMSSMWKNQLTENAYQVVLQTEVPLTYLGPGMEYLAKKCLVSYIMPLFPPICFWVFSFFCIIGWLFVRQYSGGDMAMVFVLAIFVIFVSSIILFIKIIDESTLPSIRKKKKRTSLTGAPLEAMKVMGETIADTLTNCKLIASGATVVVEKSKKNEEMATIQLLNASMHDQNEFNTAIRELVTPIKKPRYLLVPKNGKIEEKCQYALACPSAIGRNKEFITILEKHLKKNIGILEAVYTGNEKGREFLRYCRDARFENEYLELDEALYLSEVNTRYIVVKKNPSLLLEGKDD